MTGAMNINELQWFIFCFFVKFRLLELLVYFPIRYVSKQIFGNSKLKDLSFFQCIYVLILKKIKETYF